MICFYTHHRRTRMIYYFVVHTIHLIHIDRYRNIRVRKKVTLFLLSFGSYMSATVEFKLKTRIKRMVQKNKKKKSRMINKFGANKYSMRWLILKNLLTINEILGPLRISSSHRRHQATSVLKSYLAIACWTEQCLWAC